MLLMSLAPVLATLLAWIFLAETLNVGQVIGIFITVGGIGWVVMDRDKRRVTPAENANYLWGVMFGLGAATGQAIGLITAKKGLTGDFPALSGNLIRMISASIVMWGFTLARGRVGFTVRRFLDQPKAAANIIGGAFFGPFLGVWLSLVAVQLTQIGVASTLMALAPIFLLPVSYLFFKERFGWRAVVGTLIAVTGVALLFLT
jgi:drug/metabolite transporter (DMT)-like permease